MKTIDLHGVKHVDAYRIIENACSQYCTPIVIITGNSREMKSIVEATASLFNLRVRDYIGNTGRLVIDEAKGE